MNRILNRKTVGGFLLAALVLMIFFSKTIYSRNLPSVTAVKPQNGRLSKLETSSGVAGWADVENIFAAVGGTVEEVLAKEGDSVTAGQELLRLTFDRDDAERKLKELQNSRSKLYTDIESARLKIEKLDRYINDLLDESYEEEEVSRADIELLHLDIRKAQADLREARDQYDSGEATEEKVDRARYSLQALYVKLEELEKKLEKQEEDAKKSLEEKEKSRGTKLIDYEQEIAALNLDIRNKSVDLNGLSLQEEPYKKALEDFDTQAVIRAPVSGSLISLGAGKGERVQEAQLVASVGAGGGFTVECNISLDNNFVVPGDECELSNTSHVLKGTVSRVTPTAQGKTVSVELASDEVSSGETFDIKFDKESKTSYTLIPNGALNQDNDGYFLNQVKRRDGILGSEYYLERLDVFIGDSDSKNTVVIRGITFFEPVALVADSPVAAGDVINLENAGDFFEN